MDNSHQSDAISMNIGQGFSIGFHSSKVKVKSVVVIYENSDQYGNIKGEHRWESKNG